MSRGMPTLQERKQQADAVLDERARCSALRAIPVFPESKRVAAERARVAAEKSAARETIWFGIKATAVIIFVIVALGGFAQIVADFADWATS